ncbi:LysE family translocator [Thalassotalea aquiviva]|uniref:LysE family translocator n=1 Tax=Thalassotalea aquiviva TaxID=3242415 RepID=UPI00352B2513
MISTYLTYATMSALVASTPGPSNYIAAQNGAKAGLRKASFAITGHMSAILLLAFFSAIGLSTLIINSPIVFTGLQWFGAAYLCYLGIKIIKGSLASSSGATTTPQQELQGSRKLWRQHFLIAASNPKAMLFFTALFPQFINPEQNLLEQFIPLACISLTSSFIFPFAYALVGKKTAQLGLPGPIQKYGQVLVGILFMVFALMLFRH